MHTTGIVRRVDNLGRICIPKEFRRRLGIKEEEPLEIFIDIKNKMIGIQKFEFEEEEIK